MITMFVLLLALTVNEKMLFSFDKAKDMGSWTVVNDDVMGGRSTASMELTDKGTALFKGIVSLENNGGFSSIRNNMETVDATPYGTLVLRLKGDGKNYQVRVREKRNDYFSYIYTFETSGNWENVEIPLAEMYPSFRGRKLNRPNYAGKKMVELSFLIANNKAESFALELANAHLK